MNANGLKGMPAMDLEHKYNNWTVIGSSRSIDLTVISSPFKREIVVVSVLGMVPHRRRIVSSYFFYI